MDYLKKEIKFISKNKDLEKEKEDGKKEKEMNIILNIWDTSGSEMNLNVLPSNLYRKADAFLICCSYDNKDSLINVKSWLEYIKRFNDTIEKTNATFMGSILTDANVSLQNTNNLSLSIDNTNIVRKEPIPVIMICNKYDLPQSAKKFGIKEIHSELKTEMLSQTFKIKIYHQVSAKENLNIEYIFTRLASNLTSAPIYIGSNKSNKENKLYTNTFSLPDPKRKKNDISFNMEASNKSATITLRKRKDFGKCKDKCCK